MRCTLRAPMIGAVLFIAGSALGVAMDRNIRQGATLASVLPEAIMALTYATPSGMTTVQRSAPGAPFHVLSTFADGRPAQRCSMPATVEKRLGSLATLTARRSLSPAQRESAFPVQLGVIDVRDAVLAEPSGPVLVFANEDKSAVAVMFDGRAAEVTLRAAELGWLENPCAGRP